MSDQCLLAIHPSAAVIRVQSNFRMNVCHFDGDVHASYYPGLVLSPPVEQARIAFGTAIASVDGVNSFRFNRYSGMISVGPMHDVAEVARNIVQALSVQFGPTVNVTMEVDEPVQVDDDECDEPTV